MTALEVRLWSHVEKMDECWLWTGARTTNGYGRITVGGKGHQAHRVAWMLASGAIPDGLYVCHRCDVKLCVRPAHLFLGTQHDNMQDAKAKGRLNTSLAVATRRRNFWSRAAEHYAAYRRPDIATELATGVPTVHDSARHDPTP
jgi:hypothetical protein